MVTKIK